ncbi:sigma-70 family RNA polymerase sigma factor [Clostridium sp. CMCC3677]|uniref:RNA polymerase sigma factor n=1 Tax=Clostridium sp. CMCC3677 TaxID=2949963 RepID=UPI0013F0FAFA|nr:sigma-70 family RNA polymerase sigma factor [Clostridium sp. CMCC3677]NFG62487.1 sigma-70 family RNA polymerase sigma factor [Clostridium botulinum]NFQ08993.1 sigma-70 family RNA polymerase sigma factor [Clostridium botulinum]
MYSSYFNNFFSCIDIFNFINLNIKNDILDRKLNIIKQQINKLYEMNITQNKSEKGKVENNIVDYNKLKKYSTEYKASKGDKEAFIELITENKLSLYRVAKGILKNEERVEDAIQNTILKAYENIVKIKKHEYFKTWIIRILINECKAIIKKEKRVIYLDETIIEGNYEDKYQNIDLETALNNIDEDLRELVVLYYFDDIPQKEIAKILNINETTVRTRLLRARKKLYELLKLE